MNSLGALVESVVPRVSPASRRVVRSLIDTRGRLDNPNGLARSVGLRDRHQLGRVLAADGPPCPENLAGWIRILGWALEAEASGMGLDQSALCALRDPRSSRRTIKRLTERTWSEIRLLGSAWVLLQFATAIRYPKAVTRAPADGSGSEPTPNRALSA